MHHRYMTLRIKLNSQQMHATENQIECTMDIHDTKQKIEYTTDLGQENQNVLFPHMYWLLEKTLTSEQQNRLGTLRIRLNTPQIQDTENQIECTRDT